MLYTDDEIIEYEYEFADDVKWQDDKSESAELLWEIWVTYSATRL